MSVSAFLFIYVLGGLTLIPLVLATVLLHAYITLPVKEEGSSSADECARDTPDRDSNQLDTAFESLPRGAEDAHTCTGCRGGLLCGM